MTEESKAATRPATAVNRPTTDRALKTRGKKCAFCFFWKANEGNGVFSQWFESKFTVDGVEYSCAEQFMMAEKAKLMGDESTR